VEGGIWIASTWGTRESLFEIGFFFGAAFPSEPHPEFDVYAGPTFKPGQVVPEVPSFTPVEGWVFVGGIISRLIAKEFFTDTWGELAVGIVMDFTAGGDRAFSPLIAPSRELRNLAGAPPLSLGRPASLETADAVINSVARCCATRLSPTGNRTWEGGALLAFGIYAPIIQWHVIHRDD
jgi:hypothetical protein